MLYFFYQLFRFLQKSSSDLSKESFYLFLLHLNVDFSQGKCFSKFFSDIFEERLIFSNQVIDSYLSIKFILTRNKVANRLGLLKTYPFVHESSSCELSSFGKDEIHSRKLSEKYCNDSFRSVNMKF